ncbi:carbohydrate ABC transporter permease [Allokutzneria sp. NRRL B-24872]|uniref:carbohydrate ABC transporter permease n=1 Tax=Allokutzneria sp. NRRL B-24872 TaxID=1137961 RepID=UPI001FEF58D8|nr:sugar ABC transporter permease [Allokutzneria sp. NRRL B-24872]
MAGDRGVGRVVPLVPAVALLGVFLIGPVLWTVYLSFTNTALSGSAARAPSFTGLDNFARLIEDPALLNAVWLTVVFTIGSAVIGQNCLGMLLAVLLAGRSKLLRSAVGGVVVLAWVLPELVAAFAVYAFLNADGTLNALLAWLGLPGQNWLYTAPMAAVVLANVWRGTAFSMLSYQAAMSDVPSDLLEAAQMDGAGPLRRFWHVTLPTIRRTVVTTLLLITLQTIGVFALIYVLTAGGPGEASQTLPLLMYEQAFVFREIGYGTATALVLLLVGGLFAAVYARTLREELR